MGRHAADDPDAPGDAGWPDAGFLVVPRASPDVQRLYDEDVAGLGFVMNGSRLWAQLPEAHDALFALQQQAVDAASLTLRQRGILVTACASTLGDSYCSLAWGGRLAAEAGEDLAGAVLRGEDDGLTPAEQALAHWARQLARDPNATGLGDVAALREAGYDDRQIFALTLFVAVRLAFSTVNDALGVRPEPELLDSTPASVRDVITFGRPPGTRSPPA
jgi:uncharacterized peroxidase-related enzyme